ncbi:acyltransferase family protein [Lipingzhangella sp. LS1_29]|uniref:Acyltransferase family protein n=1 Tax=Lipingzhangella rawalii TaxID=2055835 RepID=A0ABU2H1U5_9ACTN|nr:acyltransferase family protein [Lipingzhangella rawalii]MDS1268839.1 acyltransferase family protein [Lipingzhangella rawalii]
MPQKHEQFAPRRPEPSTGPIGPRKPTGSRGHLPEIEGLRGLAVALVVIYHIWFNRVSGGVDVFFLLSGLLITWSLTARLVRPHLREAPAWLGTHCARLSRRVVPPALFVLVGIGAATVLWLPQVRWPSVQSELTAAALFVQNWHLAGNAVDYLAAQNAAGPAQHYWSLAVQMQFYLLWPLVILGLAVLAHHRGWSQRSTLLCGFTVVAGASLAYSIAATVQHPQPTYFNTLARLWEFALGGLLALALPSLRPSRHIRLLLGWLGLVALVTCGVIITTADGHPGQFPGYAALWPTLAAASLIVCSAAGPPTRVGADRLLRIPALRWLGRYSFSLYLWHWPLLVCYLAVTGRTVPTLGGGALVVLASLTLAVGTHWLLEHRLPASGLGQHSTHGGLALGAAFLVPVLTATGAWGSVLHTYQHGEHQDISTTGSEDYPGAAALTQPPEPDVPYRPTALEARGDLPVVYETGCHQDQASTEAHSCTFGASMEHADRTVALVGGSHAAHWLPALRLLAEEHSWRVVSMTKSACLFSAEQQQLDGAPYTACHAWNDDALQRLAVLDPDAVFTTATRIGGGREYTPDGYLRHWRHLSRLGIDVIAVRDTPWPMVDVPECVETHGRDAVRCGRSRADMYPSGPPDVAQREDLPDSVTIVDLTDRICTPDHCPAVVGNILVYRDNSHLTASYARTLAHYLHDQLQPLH